MTVLLQLFMHRLPIGLRALPCPSHGKRIAKPLRFQFSYPKQQVVFFSEVNGNTP
jgi:hypothetical protein